MNKAEAEKAEAAWILRITVVIVPMFYCYRSINHKRALATVGGGKF